MINTVNTKKEQLLFGYFQIDTGDEWVLIVGSCRCVPYLNYLHDWNKVNNNRFTIFFIDPFNFNYDLSDNRVSMEDKIQELETNDDMLFMLYNTDTIIHEYYNNYGMFSFDRSSPKNIYQFGLNPRLDICIPNFNDLFILAGDIVTFDTEIRKKAIQDYNVIGRLSEDTREEIVMVMKSNLSKFYKVCEKSSIPEMIEYFHENYMTTRFFWNYNHVTKWFTLAVFHYINDLFLHLDLRRGFDENHVDMFANNYTHLTEYDPFEWGEQIKPLKEKL